MRIAFFGDGILDNYWQLEATKFDPAGTPTYTRLDEGTKYPGGAWNAAESIKHFATASTFAPVMVEIDRYIVNGAERFRIDSPTMGRPDEIRKALVEKLIDSEWDALVVSDYLKGMVNAEALRDITNEVRRRNVPCVIDAKQFLEGVYYGGCVVKCNEKERPHVGAVASVVTRAGLPPLVNGEPIGEQRFPNRPFQSCGAGDAFAAFLAFALAEGGNSLRESAAFAHQAAAAAGFFPPFRQAVLPREVGAIRAPERLKILHGKNELAEWCRYRAAGRVVVTNGCFDVLHAGHVANLEECRRQGDKLLVLVNSDESVRAIKGPDRPVMPVIERMRILAGLECVDAVAGFGEPTPETTLAICVSSMLRSFSVLCKGPDCDPETVPGRQYAERVHITGSDYPCRSAQIISRIREVAT